jgi:RNA-binding protein
MSELSGWQKQYLRGLAHHMKPLVQIGKFGVTEKLVAAIKKALDDHELIKIKFMDFKDEKDALMQKISVEARAEVIGLIGNVLIIYRKNHDKEKSKIKIPNKKP